MIIYAVINNYLASIPVEKIKQYQKDLIEELKTNNPSILEGIRNDKVISPENEESLKAALVSFAATYTG